MIIVQKDNLVLGYDYDYVVGYRGLVVCKWQKYLLLLPMVSATLTTVYCRQQRRERHWK